MNLKHAQIILEKISRLYKTMKMDERNIDVFEQDLMLSYIRQLYESFSPDKPVSKRVKPVLPPEEIPAPPPPTPKPRRAAPKKEVAPPPPTPKPEPPKVVEPPKIVEPPKVAEKPAPAPVPTPPPPAPAPPKPKPSPPPTPAAAPKAAVSTTGLSPSDQEELFGIPEASELSEKLGSLPIKDLTKAMGLNEKIFTINELFGGDSKLFDETIKTLNNFNSFEEAKVYLSAYVADRFSWAGKKHKKKALNFIKLIRRRYN